MLLQKAAITFTLATLLSRSMVSANIWTVDCGLLTTQRMDPIVFPYLHPAGHVHSIVGGSKFSESATNQDLLASSCTSCNVGDDLSNYWVPQLYIWKQSDGKFHYVDMEFHVYYKLINEFGQTDRVNNPLHPGDILAFPDGFQMLAGSPNQKEPLHYISHQCMGPGTTTNEFPPNPDQCWAVRAEASFPSCWDGVNLEGESGTSTHMAFPIGGWEAGKCPPTHPKRLPTLFFEAIFKTGDIYEAGDRLVYSFNDYTGYGFHGDFLHGWKEGVMDGLLNYCINNDDGFSKQCGIDKHGSMGGCAWEGTEDDQQYKGVLDQLPPWN